MEEQLKIPLKNRKQQTVGFAIIDSNDYDKLSKLKWHKTSYGYASATTRMKKNVTMHKMVIGCDVPPGHVIDHINHNRLDNRKSNLRIASRSLNNHNRQTISKSGFLGVCQQQNGKYRAHFENKTLGVYEDPQIAAQRYDICAFLKYGKYAKTNNTINYEQACEKKLEDMFVQLRKPRELPQNIYILDKDNPTSYRIEIKYQGKRFRKQGFSSVKEAMKCLNKFKSDMNKEKNIKRQIERNIDGIPVIKVKGHEILVDDEAWDDLSAIKWALGNDLYARGQKDNKKFTMHRYIVGCIEEGVVVDHINKNKLDNRSCNLRIVTYAQNNQNRFKVSNIARYTGVTKKGKIWTSRIGHDGKTIYIGCFKQELQAAVAYNLMARQLFGIQAHTNDVHNENDILNEIQEKVLSSYRLKKEEFKHQVSL